MKWSKVLCALGVTGVIATAVTSSIATRKALVKLKESKDSTGVDPPKEDAIKMVWKYYIPPLVSIIGTSACIIGAENVNAKTIAGATASLALLKKSYDKYGQSVKNVFGIEGDKKVREDIIKTDGKPIPEKEEVYWIGFGYDDYFKAKPTDIERAEYLMNRKLRMGDTVSVSDFFEIVGIEPNVISGSWGWSQMELFDIMDDGWLIIDTDLIENDNGEQEYAIVFNCYPVEDYEHNQELYKSARDVPWYT